MTTALIRCNCKHDQQDAMYGKGTRVANLVTKTGEWRCTVCGTTQTPRYAAGPAEKKPAKKK